MITVEPGHDDNVASLAKGLGIPFCRPFSSLAFIQDGEVLGGTVFNGYNGSNIDLSIFLLKPLPFRRGHYRALFDYPFNQLGVRRVTVRTKAKNKKVRKQIRRLGFKPEGRMSKYYSDDDAMVYGLTKGGCKWLPKEE